MSSNLFLKAGLFTLLAVALFIAGWELYLRGKGVDVAFDDGAQLWSDKRARVYTAPDKATVFIGSSRIKYDLDISTWRNLTGEDAVQLAIEGSSPLSVLDNLAADQEFKGKLIVDVTEGLFFSNSPPNFIEPNKNIAYYKNQTPSEKFSFKLNTLLERYFVFLDRDNYSTNAFLNKMELHSRPGVFMMPIFPMEFGRTTFDRQAKMTDEFVADTNLHRKVTNIWEFFRSISTEPPASGARLDSFLVAIKTACDKIKARGGQVLFVRTPSSGPYWMGEQQGFPRQNYWDRILSFTGSPGIHFADYTSINQFICPEWSHLTPQDAIVFTKNFVEILEKEKGWKFSHKNRAL